MGCGSCAVGGCGTKGGSPAGCRNNGTCGTKGCNKMNSFDWLGNMELPSLEKFNILEVKFKGGRKEFFRNEHFLELNTGDPVVVETQSGHHIGYVSLQGELVRLQMIKKKVENDDKIKPVLRVAAQKELEKYEDVLKRELPTMYRTREIIRQLGLQMKLSDVEFQADNTKATFYYSADDRVDFRELIKLLAGEFKIRVEMRQISLRQEAARLGGVGICGRELCCSTWLTDFKSVTTTAARYQNLSLNPTKLSGQCGRLKCCLNYELETYLDALEDIPKIDAPIRTEKGNIALQKVDIFKKIMWFSYENETNWYPLDVPQVREMMEMNVKGQLPTGLGADAVGLPKAQPTDFESSFQTDIDLLEKKLKRKKKKKKPYGSEASSDRRGNTPPVGQGPKAGTRRTEGKPEEAGKDRNRNRKPKKPSGAAPGERKEGAKNPIEILPRSQERIQHQSSVKPLKEEGDRAGSGPAGANPVRPGHSGNPQRHKKRKRPGHGSGPNSQPPSSTNPSAEK